MFIMQLQARRGGMDEPFAWESREYLRRLLIGQDVRFRVEYTASPSGRKFGMVFFAEKNVACMVVAAGLAKVRTTAFFFFSLSLASYRVNLYRLMMIMLDSELSVFFFCFGRDQVKEQGQKGEISPYVAELLRLETIARDQGLGRWSKVSSSISSFL